MQAGRDVEERQAQGREGCMHLRNDGKYAQNNNERVFWFNDGWPGLARARHKLSPRRS